MDRDSLVYKAKLAEQAERFDEMVQDMYVEDHHDLPGSYSCCAAGDPLVFP
jgi:hypothetical protein